jgi:hypothetical protein
MLWAGAGAMMLWVTWISANALEGTARAVAVAVALFLACVCFVSQVAAALR